MEMTISGLTTAGFEGFVRFAELQKQSHSFPQGAPDVPGVYAVVRESAGQPLFLSTGTGGHFKGRNPNVGVDVLEAKWNQGASVVYFGKAGRRSNGAALWSRLNEFRKFGAGKNIGHQGGRYIWQLADSSDLLVAWKTIPDEDPARVEAELIAEFKAQTGQWPYANLKG